MQDIMNDRALLDLAFTLAHQAGELIMQIRARGFETLSKSDDSPVTEADHAAEVLILKGLRAACPDIPVLAEEEIAALTDVFEEGAEPGAEGEEAAEETKAE